MSVKTAERRKQLYGLVAVALVVCICLSVVLLSTPKMPSQTQQSDTETQATTAPTPSLNQTTEANTNTNDETTQNITYNVGSPPTNYPITHQGAIYIALPYIQAYAKENNRTIMVINAEYANIPNLNKPLMDAGWKVTGSFDGFKDNVSSYGVLLYVDNGTVYTNSTIGFNISKEQALNIANTYIQSYATENHRTIKSINATFSYATTLKASLGDPRWMVTAQFTDIENGVSGYSVFLNGNDGQVYSAGDNGISAF